MRKTFPVTVMGLQLTCEIEIKLHSRDKWEWELISIESPHLSYKPTFEQLPDMIQVDIEMISESICLEEAEFKFMTASERAERKAEHQFETMRNEE